MPKLWEKSVTLEAFKKKNRLPEVPGVYFFLGKKKEVLYIGKATILRDRVKSYFSQDIMETRGPKIALMLGKIRSIAYRKTDSVLEALILETNLIKEHQPSYNTDQKDDKSYNHVVITDELFPRVLVIRGRDLEKYPPVIPAKAGIQKKKSWIPGQARDDIRIKYSFGPFPSGGGLREAMKIVRRLFPYRDTCVPTDSQQSTANSQQRTENNQQSTANREQSAVNSQQLIVSNEQKAVISQRRKKAVPQACFNRQIGLCPGVCTGEISAKEYARIINHIRLFFEGRKSMLVKRLEREMKAAAKALEFERAGEIKKTLFGLQHIQDMALVKNDERLTTHDSRQGVRIEAYDVAHLMGEASVGVMTVVSGSYADTDEYRQFRLRGDHKGNDLAALEEILFRRLKHPEWGRPDVIAVDGSFLQLGVAERLFDGLPEKPLLVGVVKDARHKAKEIIGLPAGFARLETDILLANNEAHRFAIAFHRKRRGKEFLK